MGLTKPWEQHPPPEDAPQPGAQPDPGGEAVVRQLPGTHPDSDTGAVAVPGETGPPRGVVAWRQARQAAAGTRDTIAATYDGTVYRDRPPALRDQRVRLARLDDPAGVPLLRVLLQAAGAVGLALNAYDYARAWSVRRPARLLLVGLWLRLWPLLLITQAAWGWPL